MCVGGGLSAHEGMHVLVQAPATAALPSPTPAPPHLFHEAPVPPQLAGPPQGGSFVPRQIPNGRLPLGRKGPSLACGEVTRRGYAHKGHCPPTRPAGSCLFVFNSRPRRDPEGPLLGLGGPRLVSGKCRVGQVGRGQEQPLPPPAPPPPCS